MVRPTLVIKKLLAKLYFLFAILNMNFLWLTSDGGIRNNGGGILNNSVFGIGIENKSLNFPQPKPISGFNENQKFPYTFIADEAVPSKPHVIRAYPRKGELNL